MFPYLAETIIAGVSDGIPELYVLDSIGSVLADKFAAVGTGAPIAIGVLDSEYNEGMSVDETKPVLLRAVKSAIAGDISSGDGVDFDGNHSTGNHRGISTILVSRFRAPYRFMSSLPNVGIVRILEIEYLRGK